MSIAAEGVLFSTVIPMEAFLLGMNWKKKNCQILSYYTAQTVVWPDDYENTPFWFKNLSIGIIFFIPLGPAWTISFNLLIIVLYFRGNYKSFWNSAKICQKCGHSRQKLTHS
jgi:hypothetical protein